MSRLSGLDSEVNGNYFCDNEKVDFPLPTVSTTIRAASLVLANVARDLYFN